MLSARIALPLLSMLMAIISASSSADWKYDYLYGSESEISKKRTIYSSYLIAGASRSLPVGFLRYQGAVVESYSDKNYLVNMYGHNHSATTLPLIVENDAVALDALGDYMYFQMKDPDTGVHSLERCTLVGCSVLKNNAGDPRAVQMGLPSHTLNLQDCIFALHQDQAIHLSFFNVLNAEQHKLKGSGYVVSTS